MVGDKETVVDGLLAAYGPIVHAPPYVIMYGPEANRLLVASGPEQVHTFANPEFPSIGSMDGDLQVRHRKLVMEAFHPRRMAAYAREMRRLTLLRVAGWGASIDAMAEMSALSLDILTVTMLGLEPGSPRYARFMTHYWPLLARADRTLRPWRQRRATREAKAGMWALLGELVAERRRSPTEDALGLMVTAADQDDSPMRADDDALLRYAYMLMDGAQSNIASFLAYGLTRLAVDGAQRTRLRAERRGDGLEQIVALERSLPFTLNFMREVERLHTPFPTVYRTAQTDLECLGHRIPRGSVIVSSIHHTHRDPRLFADPLRFDPDRFAAPRQEHRTPYALMGFGAGRHMCVATAYSRLQMALVLHEVFARFEVEKLGPQELPEIDYRPTLQVPRAPLQLRLRPRAGAGSGFGRGPESGVAPS